MVVKINIKERLTYNSSKSWKHIIKENHKHWRKLHKWTSFLDNELPIKQNYNKSRRIQRGLFKSNLGKLINADVNGSLQIIKKVFSNAFNHGIKDYGFNPN